MRRTIGLLAAGAAAVAGIGLTATPAAAADPQRQAGISCDFQLPDNSVGTRCFYPGPTTTRYRAWADCSNGRHATGPWYTVNSGIWSWANCGRNVFVVDWGVDLAVG
jgi:hypothetical protein